MYIYICTIYNTIYFSITFIYSFIHLFILLYFVLYTYASKIPKTRRPDVPPTLDPSGHRRNGVHLGLDPVIRRCCDFELFASPLNAAVPNGHFSSRLVTVTGWMTGGGLVGYPEVVWRGCKGCKIILLEQKRGFIYIYT